MAAVLLPSGGPVRSHHPACRQPSCITAFPFPVGGRSSGRQPWKLSMLASLTLGRGLSSTRSGGKPPSKRGLDRSGGGESGVVEDEGGLLLVVLGAGELDRH